MKTRAGFLSCVVATAALLIAACNGGSSYNPTMPSGNGQMTVQMTDATTDLVSSVNVYVKAVTVKPRNGAAVRIASDVGMVDVLTLKGTIRDLVTANVAAGDYEYVQIDLDHTKSNVVLKATGTVVALAMVDESIRVNGNITVQDGHRTIVLLDFKADQSLELAIDGHWTLNAVIVLSSTTVSS
jgi:hypothetical protein